MNNDFNRMVERFNAGRAILFTGAAFSAGSMNVLKDEKLPLADELAIKICKLGPFNNSTNLSYAADRYIKEYRDDDKKMNELVEMLKNTFTIYSASKTVSNICSAPWIKFYTTNYDNSIEVSVDGITPIDTESPVEKNEIKSKRCVHINGYIENLKLKNLNKSFKLSEASYLSPDGFLNSAWYAVFKRDLERCSMLVFAGYSLYDLDIKRILVEIPGLKEKTYFIAKEGCSEEDKYIFSQYGTVLDIGVDKFGSLIVESDQFKMDFSQEDQFSIQKYQFEETVATVHDNDIEKLLLLGKINKALIENDVLSQKNEFVVFRDYVNKISNFIASGNVIVTGDLGNGKSVLLDECLPALAIKYGNVYFIDDPYIDYITEVEGICAQNDGIKIFVIENYFLYMDLFEYLLAFNTENVRFLLTARSGKHERLKDQLDVLNFSYKELSIDLLTNNEKQSVSELIDSVGFWGSKFTSSVDKRKFIDEKCREQFAPLLLSLLDSENIKSKISAILGDLIDKDDNLKKATVTGLFISMHDVKSDLSLLSTLAGNYIYDKEIMHNESFREIFHTRKGSFDSISSVFCQKIIKDFISPKYILDLMLNIAKKLDHNPKSKVEECIYKSCFKFSTVERVLPNENKLKNIKDYYEILKRGLPWLIDDPHFWVQYAMGHISCGDYTKAQVLIDNAYGKAKQKQNYHTNNIDTQQSRLYILQAIKAETVDTAIEFFLKGHKKLLNVPNDKYKYRQISLYEKFYDSRYHDFTAEMKKSMERACNDMLGRLLIKDRQDESMREFDKQSVIKQIKNILDHVKATDERLFSTISRQDI